MKVIKCLILEAEGDEKVTDEVLKLTLEPGVTYQAIGNERMQLVMPRECYLKGFDLGVFERRDKPCI